MNYEKLGKLMVEYYKNNPIDNSETYYEYDNGHQEGMNDVKEYIKDFMNECVCECVPKCVIGCDLE